MGQIGFATLAVMPSMKGFSSKLSSGIAPEMTRAGKDAGKHFGSGLSSAATGIGGKAGKLIGSGLIAGVATVVAGVGAVIKTGFGEAMDASAGTAQLAAGIKSTGNAANVSIKGMNALASSIQGMSGQTDDSIVASEKLLLTFTNIKNKGPNKIFDQATLATANMAAKMGGDASGAAIQLGRAMQDPIKGMSALQRVGIVFDAGQKKSITSMVKHGNVMGAQKVILAELNKEFGGSAKAAGQSLPGQLARSKRAFEDVSQSVVEGLLPVVMPALLKIASVITTKVVPAISSFITGFKDGTGAGGKFRDIVKAILPFLAPIVLFVPAIKNLAKGFQDGTGPGGALRDIIKSVAGFVTENLIPALTKVYQQVLPALIGLFKSVSQTLKDHKGFVDGVKTAFKVLGMFVTDIFLPALGKIVTFLLNVLGPEFRGIVRIFETVVGPGLKWLVQKFLDMAGWIAKAAVTAFGWLPGIGPELKNSAAQFTAFATEVNNALNGIKPPAPINVRARMVWDTPTHSLVPTAGGGPAIPTAPKSDLPRPGSPAAKALAGTSITINGGIVAHDYNDFTRQLDTKARRAALWAP